MEAEYIDYEIGDKQIPVNVEAIHAQNPNGDLYTGDLARKISEQTGSSCIISKVSRDVMDLNRPRGRFNYPAIDEYRQVFTKILESKNLLNSRGFLTGPFLHLSLHGMQDSWNRAIEVGTGYGNYCTQEIKSWLIKNLENTTRNFGVDDLFPGFTFRSVLRDGDLYGSTVFMGYGKCLNSIQIEICKSWRENHQDFLVEFFRNLIEDFKKTFLQAVPIEHSKHSS